MFALALESWTFVIAWKEIGGSKGLKENRHNTTVLAVVLEDAVALLGIFLTLLVAGVGYFFGPDPKFDASIAIVVGIILGVMAVFLAALNRDLLIDASDQALDRAAEAWLAAHDVSATVRSLVLDLDRVIAFVNAKHEVADSHALGEALKHAMRESLGKTVDRVYWKFAVERAAPRA